MPGCIPKIIEGEKVTLSQPLLCKGAPRARL
jgi:hypothetical protein